MNSIDYNIKDMISRTYNYIKSKLKYTGICNKHQNFKINIGYNYIAHVNSFAGEFNVITFKSNTQKHKNFFSILNLNTEIPHFYYDDYINANADNTQFGKLNSLVIYSRHKMLCENYFNLSEEEKFFLSLNIDLDPVHKIVDIITDQNFWGEINDHNVIFSLVFENLDMFKNMLDEIDDVEYANKLKESINT